jgi:hypothetical protein
MKSVLSIYQYGAPAVLAPLSFYLWYREYHGDLRLVATAWLIPVIWAYVVPGVGTNVLKVWEFDSGLRLGRFRPHHGFVFGSATAMLAWLAHGRGVPDLAGVFREALVMASLLGFWNLLYDIKALEAGILRVYNQPWAEGKSAAEVALDYAPWFFGGFGAIYGASIAGMEWLVAGGMQSGLVFGAVFAALGVLACVLPAAGYMAQSMVRHGHWGTRPVPKKCQSA